MAVMVSFEIGHKAKLKSKKTSEGFTHDWELYVRGVDENDISYFVYKVVFNLHISFPNPKRIYTKAPYILKESSCVGFVVPIDIYFRTHGHPNCVQYLYNLDLQITGPPIHRRVVKKFSFHNPSELFKQKLLKGGVCFENSRNLVEERSQVVKPKTTISATSIKTKSGKVEKKEMNTYKHYEKFPKCEKYAGNDEKMKEKSNSNDYDPIEDQTLKRPIISVSVPRSSSATDPEQYTVKPVHKWDVDINKTSSDSGKKSRKKTNSYDKDKDFERREKDRESKGKRNPSSSVSLDATPVGASHIRNTSTKAPEIQPEDPKKGKIKNKARPEKESKEKKRKSKDDHEPFINKSVSPIINPNIPPKKQMKKDEVKNENSGSPLLFGGLNSNSNDRGSASVDYMSELQHKIMALQDNNNLQKVVEIIAETGRFEITSKTFDFDLSTLDRATIQRLQDFLSTMSGY